MATESLIHGPIFEASSKQKSATFNVRREDDVEVLTEKVVIPGTEAQVDVPLPERVDTDPSTRGRLQVWLDSYERPADITAIAGDLTGILLGKRWDWPEFNQWHARFTNGRHFPKTWSGLEYMPDEPSAEAQEVLAQVGRLSETEMSLLLSTNALTRKTSLTATPYDLARKAKTDVRTAARGMAALVVAGFARTDIPVTERLEALKKSELTAIADDQGLSASGTKTDIAQRLAAECDQAVLLPHLPPDKREELWSIEVPLPDADRPFVDFELAKIKLLGWTVRNVPVHVGRIFASLAGGMVCVARVNENCPVCRTMAGAIYAWDRPPVVMPPFHPGCTCELMQVPPEQVGIKPAAAGCASLVAALGGTIGLIAALAGMVN